MATFFANWPPPTSNQWEEPNETNQTGIWCKFGKIFCAHFEKIIDKKFFWAFKKQICPTRLHFTNVYRYSNHRSAIARTLSHLLITGVNVQAQSQISYPDKLSRYRLHVYTRCKWDITHSAHWVHDLSPSWNWPSSAPSAPSQICNICSQTWAQTSSHLVVWQRNTAAISPTPMVARVTRYNQAQEFLWSMTATFMTGVVINIYKRVPTINDGKL